MTPPPRARACRLCRVVFPFRHTAAGLPEKTGSCAAPGSHKKVVRGGVTFISLLPYASDEKASVEESTSCAT